MNAERKLQRAPRTASPLLNAAAALAACLLFTLLGGPSLAEQAGGADPSDIPQSDLDAELLEDLGQDLFGEDVPQGEDIGQSSTADDPMTPLEQIGDRMKSAQRMLLEGDASGSASRLQERIVHDLDALIKDVQRRQRQSQQGGNSSPGSQRSDAQPQGSQPGQAVGEGEEPAADSADQPRSGTGSGSPSADMRSMREQIFKDLWGDLPARAREQMLQSYEDEFLPKYELELEQYFRRLAEDPDLDGR